MASRRDDVGSWRRQPGSMPGLAAISSLKAKFVCIRQISKGVLKWPQYVIPNNRRYRCLTSLQLPVIRGRSIRSGCRYPTFQIKHTFYTQVNRLNLSLV